MTHFSISLLFRLSEPDCQRRQAIQGFVSNPGLLKEDAVPLIVFFFSVAIAVISAIVESRKSPALMASHIS